MKLDSKPFWGTSGVQPHLLTHFLVLKKPARISTRTGCIQWVKNGLAHCLSHTLAQWNVEAGRNLGAVRLHWEGSEGSWFVGHLSMIYSGQWSLVLHPISMLRFTCCQGPVRPMRWQIPSTSSNAPAKINLPISCSRHLTLMWPHRAAIPARGTETWWPWALQRPVLPKAA